MLELLARVIPLALGAAVSPILFAIVVAVLTGSGAVRRGIAFAAGAVVPLLGLGVVVLLVGAAIALPDSPTAKAVIDIVLGVVLLGVGAGALIRRPGMRREERPPPPERGAAHAGRYVPLGFTNMATNVTTLALFIPAMKLIAESGIETVEKAVAASLVIVITMSTVLVPVGLVALAPQAAGRVLRAISDFFHAHSRRAIILLGFGFGTLLTIRGIIGL